MATSGDINSNVTTNYQLEKPNTNDKSRFTGYAELYYIDR